MNVSAARAEANRRNSQKSTGPKTVEGKERSCQNSRKHGLTGQGLVLSEHDQAEVDRRDQALQSELAPSTVLGAILVRQLAMLSVRIERGSRQEFAAVAEQIRHADERFDQDRADRAEVEFAGLADDPRRTVARLRKTTEGIDLLITAWHDLRSDLTRTKHPIWTPAHFTRLGNLLGLPGEKLARTRLDAISKAAWGFLAELEPEERTSMESEARKAWARNHLIERIDAALKDLEDERATLDTSAIALDRAEARDRALFDPSKAATLARRYESESRRCFFRTLHEFRQVEADSVDSADSAEEPCATESDGPVASFRETRPGPSDGDRLRQAEPPQAAQPKPVVADREGSRAGKQANQARQVGVAAG